MKEKERKGKKGKTLKKKVMKISENLRKIGKNYSFPHWPCHVGRLVLTLVISDQNWSEQLNWEIVNRFKAKLTEFKCLDIN